MALATAKK